MMKSSEYYRQIENIIFSLLMNGNGDSLPIQDTNYLLEQIKQYADARVNEMKKEIKNGTTY